jgi:MFS transporter, SHS family, lactate transporter
LMLSILWFSLFAFLSGFSTSYAMLFACRALFGIGMGGEWAAGMPLTLEHWPAHLRGTASGMLQSGFSWGFILSAVAFQTIYPVFHSHPSLGWRAMFWIGVIPALLVLWIRTGVSESPVWLERQKHLNDRKEKDQISLLRILKRDMIGITLHTSLVLTAFMFSYHSTTFWYATYLRQSNAQPFWYLIALNIGGILGAIMWGRVSETRFGRRGAATTAALMGISAVPLYLMTSIPFYTFLGALIMGFGGAGMWGVVPGYLTERFPTAARGVGPGFAYHVGAAIGSFTPTLIGALKDRGMMLNHAMALFIAGSNLLVMALMWAGPETKGTHFAAVDHHDDKQLQPNLH